MRLLIRDALASILLVELGRASRPRPATHRRVSRPAAFDNKGGPIPTTSFNHTGRIFAYAVTQDWSGGHMSNKPDFVNKVYLHPCKDEVRTGPGVRSPAWLGARLSRVRRR